MIWTFFLLVAPAIELHRPIDRVLAPTQIHSYQVKAERLQYARVLIDPEIAAVSVRLQKPDGSVLFEATSEDGETLPVSWKTVESGAYTLEVRLPSPTMPAVRYRISLATLREATAEDEKRMAGERSFIAGNTEARKRTAPALRLAINRFEESLRIWRDLADRAMQARTLAKLGEAHYYLDERREALAEYGRALPLWEAERDGKHEAIALNSLGVIYTKLGNRNEAVDCYQRALPLRRAAGDRKGEATAVHNIGFTYYWFGDTSEAIVYLEKALPLRREVHDADGEATTLNLLGQLYATRNYPKAQECLERALRLRRAIADHYGEASTLQNLGALFSGLGDPEQALGYYQSAIQILRGLGSKLGTADALNNVGRAYLMQGQPVKALPYLEEGLAIRRAGEDRAAEANSWESIGRARLMSGAAAQALDPFQHALALARDAHASGQEATLHLDLGLAYNSLGDPARAREHLELVLNRFQSTGNVSYQIPTLGALAQSDRALGNLSEARNDAERAVALIEGLRGRITDLELKLSYFASVREQYELLIALLMESHRPAAAFEVSERARARSLLDLLNAAHADIRAGVDAALLERERSLQSALSAKSERQIRLLGSNHPEQQAALESEINSLTQELDHIEAEIRYRSPRYAALARPQPLTLAGIQHQVLDRDTLLLEYSLGEDRSYVWAVTTESLDGFELPKRSIIEALAHQVYETFSVDDSTADNISNKAIEAISQMLVGPVASRLGSKRLVVVADGGLQYIPFAPLTSPLTHRPLIQDHEITYLPSASTLAVLRAEWPRRKPAARVAAILADPVFDASDPRVADQSKGKPQAATPDLERSANELGIAAFDRLPFTRREADELAALAGNGQYYRAVDFAASRAVALSPDLANYRIVHLASHGLLNPSHPELSGIVLSLVDSHGQPQNGFLRTPDIYNMHLAAELVTLSACQTALGKDVKGEGLVGLTRGFMYAGAARVMASLWRIPDRATAELMKRLYRGMLMDGLAPSAALRRAQVAMSQDDRWTSPHHWAAFVLQGEWR